VREKFPDPLVVGSRCGCCSISHTQGIHHFTRRCSKMETLLWENIQHPTSNAQHPMGKQSIFRCSMFDVSVYPL
jgi:hypothetical protein